MSIIRAVKCDMCLEVKDVLPLIRDHLCLDCLKTCANAFIQEVHVYTDGSCRLGVGGWAFKCNDAVERGFEFDTTSQRMELLAIIRAFEYAKTIGDSVVLHTDSQYAAGIVSLKSLARKNIDMVTTLRDLVKQFKKVEVTLDLKKLDEALIVHTEANLAIAEADNV